MKNGEIRLKGIEKETLKSIEKYLRKENIVEICINEEEKVFLEDLNGKWHTIKDKNITRERMGHLIENIANMTHQRFSESYPIVSSYIPVEGWGFRFQAAMSPAVADNGFMISIRMGNARIFKLESYFEDEKTREIVKAMMEKGENLLISGGTSTGKTTMLNSLLTHIPKENRIITLENMKELAINQKNNVRLLVSESRDKKGYELAMNCILKSRPDRIIIGELTPELTKWFMRLANTGHDGTCTTVHGNTPEEALMAVYKNLVINGAAESEMLRRDVADTIKHVIHCTRGKGRKITARIYKTSYGNGEYQAKEITNEQ